MHTSPIMYPIPNLFGYSIAPDGRVFSTWHNWRGHKIREMRQHPDGFGYMSVRLTTRSVRKRYKVHVLVAHTYLPPRPDGCTQLRHLDGDKVNNSVYNLAWGTAQDNADDRESHGNTSRGKKHSQAIKAGLAKIKEG